MPSKKKPKTHLIRLNKISFSTGSLKLRKPKKSSNWPNSNENPPTNWISFRKNWTKRLRKKKRKTPLSEVCIRSFPNKCHCFKRKRMSSRLKRPMSSANPKLQFQNWTSKSKMSNTKDKSFQTNFKTLKTTNSEFKASTTKWVQITAICFPLNPMKKRKLNNWNFKWRMNSPLSRCSK